MTFFRRKRRRRRTTVTAHYLLHKENARVFIHERVLRWNELYDFEFKRIAVRNQRTCWGSCTEYKNLNFNYKLLFLPQHLADYIIVHELCHLSELNHSAQFWKLVGRALPNYKEHKKELQKVCVIGSRLVRS